MAPPSVKPAKRPLDASSPASAFFQPRKKKDVNAAEVQDASADATSVAIPSDSKTNGIPATTAVVKRPIESMVVSTFSTLNRPLPSQITIMTPFDKQRWIAGLTPEQRELLDLEITTLDDSWLAVLYDELTKPYFLKLKEFLKSETLAGKRIFPPKQDIYSWSRHTPLSSVKVVILGQDPYHNVNQAHGLAFSVNPPTPPPPSLQNIYKCLQRCYADFEIPKTGSLMRWADQGVLLLNACLTVQAHNANSHAKRGWEQFTEQVLLAALRSRPNGLCFLAWGTPAAKRIAQIKPDSRSLILRSVHPSPLSASRGFFDCEHFLKANLWLKEKYGPQGVIDWALVEGNRLKGVEQLRGENEEEKEMEENNENEKENREEQAEATMEEL